MIQTNDPSVEPSPEEKARIHRRLDQIFGRFRFWLLGPKKPRCVHWSQHHHSVEVWRWSWKLMAFYHDLISVEDCTRCGKRTFTNKRP